MLPDCETVAIRQLKPGIPLRLHYYQNTEIRVPLSLSEVWGDRSLIDEVFVNFDSNAFRCNRSEHKWAENGVCGSDELAAALQGERLHAPTKLRWRLGGEPDDRPSDRRVSRRYSLLDFQIRQGSDLRAPASGPEPRRSSARSPERHTPPDRADERSRNEEITVVKFRNKTVITLG